MQTPWTSNINGTNFALTNVKTLSFNSEISIGTTGGTVNVDWTAGQDQFITLTAATTFTFTAPLGANTNKLRISQGPTGGWGVTLPATCKVSGGGAGSVTLTATANAIDILSFYYNGTNYYVTAGKNFT